MTYIEYLNRKIDAKKREGEDLGFIPWVLVVLGMLFMIAPSVIGIFVMIITFSLPELNGFLAVIKLFLGGLFLFILPFIPWFSWMYICWKADGEIGEDL